MVYIWVDNTPILQALLSLCMLVELCHAKYVPASFEYKQTFCFKTAYPAHQSEITEHASRNERCFCSEYTQFESLAPRISQLSLLWLTYPKQFLKNNVFFFLYFLKDIVPEVKSCQSTETKLLWHTKTHEVKLLLTSSVTH